MAGSLGSAHGSLTIDASQAIASIRSVAAAMGQLRGAGPGGDPFGKIAASAKDAASAIKSASGQRFSVDTGDAVGNLTDVAKEVKDTASSIKGASGQSFDVDGSDAIGTLQQVQGSAQDAAATLSNLHGNVEVSGVGTIQAASQAAQGLASVLAGLSGASVDFSGPAAQLSQMANDAERVKAGLSGGGGVGGLGAAGLAGGGGGVLAGIPLAGGLKMGFDNAVNLEQELTNVRATLGDVSDEDFGKLNNAIIQIGVNSQFSGVEVAGISEELAKAGYGVDQQLGGKMLGAVVDLASATGTDLGTAITGVTQSMAIWSPAIVDSSIAMTDSSRAADILTVAANESSASVHDIIAGVRNLGPIAAQMHVPFEQVAGAVAMFTNYGLKGADAGVSLARGLQNLNDPTSEASALMGQLGINVFDTQGAFVGFPSLFDQLHTSMAGMTDQQKLTNIGILFGAEAQDVFTQAIAAGKDPLEEITRLMNNQGLAAEQAAKRQDTLHFALQRLTEGLGTTLGSFITPWLGPIKEIVDTVASIVGSFSQLPAPIRAAAGAVLAFATAMAAIKTITFLSGLVSAFTGAGAAASGAAGGVGIFSGALATLGAAIPIVTALLAVGAAGFLAYKTNFLGFGDAVDTGIGYVKDFANSITGANDKQDNLNASQRAYVNQLREQHVSEARIQDYLEKSGIAKEYSAKQYDLLSKSQREYVDGLRKQNVSEARIADYLQKSGISAEYTTSKYKYLRAQGLNPVAAGLTMVSDALFAIGGDNTPAFFVGLGQAIKGASKFAQNFGDYASQAFHLDNAEKMLNKFPAPLREMVHGLGTVIDTFGDLTRAYKQGGLRGVLAAIPDELGDIGRAGQRFLGGMGDLFRSAAKYAGPFEGVVRKLGTQFDTFGDMALDLGMIARKVFQGDWKGALGEARHLTQGLWKAMGQGVDILGDVGGLILDGIGSLAKTLGKKIPGLGKVFSGIEQAATGLGEMMGGVFGGISDLLHGDVIGAIKNFGKSFVGAGKLLTGVSSAMWGGISALASGMRSGLGRATDYLQGRFSSFSGTIGKVGKIFDGLLGVVEGIGDGFSSLMQGDVKGFFKGLGDAGKSAFDALGAAATALPQLLIDTFNAIPWGDVGSGIMSGLGSLFSGAGNIISGVWDSLSSAVSTIDWGSVWDSVQDISGDIASKLGDWADAAAGWALKGVAAITSNLRQLGAAALNSVPSIVGQVVDKLGDWGSAAAGWAVKGIAAITSNLAQIGAVAANAVPEVVTHVVEKLGDWTSAAAGWVSKGIAAITGNLAQLGAVIANAAPSNVVGSVVEKLGDWTVAAAGWVLKGIAAITSNLSQLGAIAVNSAPEIVTQIFAKLGDLALGAATWAARGIAAMTAILAQIGAVAVNAVPEVASQLFDKLGDLASAAATWTSKGIAALSAQLAQMGAVAINAVPDVAQAIVDKLGDLAGLLQTKVENAISGISGLWSTIVGGVPDIAQGMVDALGDFAGLLKTKITNAIEGLTGTFDGVISKLKEIGGLIEDAVSGAASLLPAPGGTGIMGGYDLNDPNSKLNIPTGDKDKGKQEPGAPAPTLPDPVLIGNMTNLVNDLYSALSTLNSGLNTVGGAITGLGAYLKGLAANGLAPVKQALTDVGTSLTTFSTNVTTMGSTVGVSLTSLATGFIATGTLISTAITTWGTSLTTFGTGVATFVSSTGVQLATLANGFIATGALIGAAIVTWSTPLVTFSATVAAQSAVTGATLTALATGFITTGALIGAAMAGMGSTVASGLATINGELSSTTGEFASFAGSAQGSMSAVGAGAQAMAGQISGAAQVGVGAARDLTGAINNIPTSHNTDITLTGAGGAIADANSVASAIAGIPTSKTISVNIAVSGSIPQVAATGGVISRGGVKAGGNTMIARLGEEGGEALRFPNGKMGYAPTDAYYGVPAGTYVYTNAETRRMQKRGLLGNIPGYASGGLVGRSTVTRGGSVIDLTGTVVGAYDRKAGKNILTTLKTIMKNTKPENQPGGKTAPVSASRTALNDAKNLFSDKTWSRREKEMRNPNDVRDLFADRTRLSRDDFALRGGRYTEHYGSGMVPRGINTTTNTTTNVYTFDPESYGKIVDGVNKGLITHKAGQAQRTAYKAKARNTPLRRI